MPTFNVYYIDADGASNHSILEANYCNEAAEYVESTKGGRVWRVECTDFDAFRKWAIEDMAESTLPPSGGDDTSPSTRIRQMRLGR